jgi:hypothetical protein
MLEIRNIFKPDNEVIPKLHAAMFYKTEPMYRGINYSHTNNWEIVAAIKLLNNNGIVVDLIDITNSNWKPQIKYDIFLGLGVGNSGRNFARYASMSGAKVKVLLAMGPEPNISNNRVLERYDYFRSRTGINAPPMRTVSEVINDKFKEIIDQTDIIFTIGERNTKSYNSYLYLNKPIITAYPAVSDKVRFDNQWLQTRNENSFLIFAGHGMICKGVDLVTEAFLRMKDKNLYICAPPETGFMNAYQTKIANSNNIKYCGFIDVGGQKFNELASLCSYVILHSAAEGHATSITTAMRAGLVPIINEWTSIDINNAGKLMSDDIHIDCIVDDIIKNISNLDKSIRFDLTEKTNELATRYSQTRFVEDYKNLIKEILSIV